LVSLIVAPIVYAPIVCRVLADALRSSNIDRRSLLTGSRISL
jgi:hypothetical protein